LAASQHKIKFAGLQERLNLKVLKKVRSYLAFHGKSEVISKQWQQSDGIKNFVRVEIAKKLGLKSVIVLPLIYNGEKL